jgi:hypothetical protein
MWYNLEMKNKRHLDQFDLEAEKEGGAIRQHGGIPTSRLGKAIAKQRKMHARGECIQTTRIIKRGKWLV